MNRFKTFMTVVLCTLAMLATACVEEPQESRGSVAGIVTDEADGHTPLSGVTVAIADLGKSAVTGSDGAFLLSELEPGQHTIQFSKAGYASTTRTARIEAGKRAEISIQMRKDMVENSISVSPSSLNFGSSQTSMIVTITNNSTRTAQWSLDLADCVWLSCSRMAGSVNAGASQSVTFSVDRRFVASISTAIVNINAGGNDYPIIVSVAPEGAASEMVISPSTLDFGTNQSSLSLNIRNVGTKTLTWRASNVPDGLTLSPSQGTVTGGGSAAVVATLDRNRVAGEYMNSFIISDGITDQSILVSANTTGGGTGTDPSGNVVTNGLAAYYMFENNCDDSANEFHGFEVDSPEYTDGISGHGIKFSKTKKSSVQIPYNLMGSKEMSVSFWAKNINDGLIFYSQCTDNADRLKLVMKNNRFGFFNSYTKDSYIDYESQYFSHPAVSDANWHHIALCINAEYRPTIVLYVDGKKVGTINDNFGDYSYQKTKSLVIGGSTIFGNTYLDVPAMTIDNFRVYDTRMLTDDEVKELYNARQ